MNFIYLRDKLVNGLSLKGSSIIFKGVLCIVVNIVNILTEFIKIADDCG